MVCWAVVFLWRWSVGNTSRHSEEMACFQMLHVCWPIRWVNMLKMSNFTWVCTVWFILGCLTCGRVSDSQRKLVLLGKQHGRRSTDTGRNAIHSAQTDASFYYDALIPIQPVVAESQLIWAALLSRENVGLFYVLKPKDWCPSVNLWTNIYWPASFQKHLICIAIQHMWKGNWYLTITMANTQLFSLFTFILRWSLCCYRAFWLKTNSLFLWFVCISAAVSGLTFMQDWSGCLSRIVFVSWDLGHFII